MRYQVHEIGTGRHLGSIDADLTPHATEKRLRWLTAQVPVFLNDDPKPKLGADPWIWTRPGDRRHVLALPGFQEHHR